MPGNGSSIGDCATMGLFLAAKGEGQEQASDDDEVGVEEGAGATKKPTSDKARWKKRV